MSALLRSCIVTAIGERAADPKLRLSFVPTCTMGELLSSAARAFGISNLAQVRSSKTGALIMQPQWIGEGEEVALVLDAGGTSFASRASATSAGARVASSSGAWMPQRTPLYADELVPASEVVHAQIIAAAGSLDQFELVRAVATSCESDFACLPRVHLRVVR